MSAPTLDSITGMPKMRAAFSGWKHSIDLQVISQNIVNGLVVDTPYDTSFRGTVQPLSPEELKLKPEGERSWEWLQIHCDISELGAIPLNTNDRIIYNSQRYKVMKKNDYSLNNYIEYHIVKDYQDE